MEKILIKNANVVNEGKIFSSDVLIENEIIAKVESDISTRANLEIDAQGKFLFPGVIDDQVHFREPGLTHKANIYSESKAAVAGGITSFMEMPNTIPATLTKELLEQKYQSAAQKSLANFSFYMGTSNDNLEEVLKTDSENVCGIKIFMGSSTGNMLVDDLKVLENIFANTNMLIATHCEDEETIQKALSRFKAKFGDAIPIGMHPEIRSAEACYLSSSLAVSLAKKYKTRLHVLHISTAKETELFDKDIPLEEKRITAEACIHHLWFEEADYEKLGTRIKWNPAVKSAKDREGIWEALLDGRLDVIATDHAPHTLDEKNNVYTKAPSGGPLVQHSLPAMLEFYNQGKISLEKIAEKMAHNPATIFQIEKRGYIREGYYADMVLVDINRPWKVDRNNILYHCGWSPFEGYTFNAQITHTLVSGHLAFDSGKFNENKKGLRLRFNR